MPSIKQGQEGIEEKLPAEPLLVEVPGLSSDWWEPFIKYLTTTDVSTDNTEREHLTRCNKHYVLVEGVISQERQGGATPEVRLCGRGQEDPQGDPRRHLWQPCSL